MTGILQRSPVAGLGTVIGVDITPRAIELCQISGVRGVGDERWVRIPVASGRAHEWGEQFRRAAATLRRRGFAGTRIVVAAPPEQCVAALLEMPSRSAEVPVSKLTRMELAREHRLDPHAIESAWWDVPSAQRSSTGRPVMTIGCPVESLRAMETAASSQGLEIVAIDARTLALARGVVPSGSHATGWQIVCDLGAAVPTAIISHDGRVVIEHRAGESTLEVLIARIAGECRTEPELAELLCDMVPFKPQSERRTQSFAVPRVMRAVREYLDGIVRGVGQCMQYHRHRFGQAPGEMTRTVVGEAWLTSRFIACMEEQGDTSWSVAPAGHGVARGLAMWSGEGPS